jgi:hypothetical protein
MQSEQEDNGLGRDLGGERLDVSVAPLHLARFVIVAVSRDSDVDGRGFDVKLSELCPQRFDRSGALIGENVSQTNPKR